MYNRLVPYLLILLPLFSFTQEEKPDYALLWRISGNELTEDSWLFGTMHVRDERAFAFSDSVLLAFEQSEAFALEVDFDEISTQIFESILEGTQASDKEPIDLHEILSEEEYNAIDKQLRSQKGIGIDQLPTKSAWHLSNFLSPELPDDNARETFLDAWLFNNAKMMGKKIIGIEQAQEQINAFGEVATEDLRKELLRYAYFEGQGTRYLNKMVDLYATGNLDSLFMLTQKATTEKEEKAILTDRNLNMAARIDSFLSMHSTFIAVGAAHLPGKLGLIQLLQEKGYKVERVSAQFTGVAEKWKPNKVKEIPWKNFTDSTSGYSLEVPVNPIAYEVKEHGLAVQLAMDIPGGMIYTFLGLTAPGGANVNLEEEKVMKSFMESYASKQGGTPIRKKNISVKGTTGKEFYVKNEAGEMYRYQVLAKKNRVFLMMVGHTKAGVQSKAAQRFFDSFSIFEPVQIEQEMELKKATTPTGGFEVEFPLEYTYTVMKTPNPNDPEKEEIPLHYFNATKKGPMTESYIFRFHDQPEGYYIQSDTLHMNDRINYLAKTLKKAPADIKEFSFEGYPAKWARFEFVESNTDKEMYVQTVLRGSRSYLMLAQGPASGPGNQRMKDYFASFKLTPFKAPKMVAYTNDTLGIGHVFPQAIPAVTFDSTLEYEEDFVEANITLSSQDTLSGTSFNLNYITFGKYFRTENLDTLLGEKWMEYKSWQDSLISSTYSHENGIHALEVRTISDEVSTIKRMKLAVKGNILLTTWGFFEPKEIDAAHVNQYFSSDEIFDTGSASDLLSSKSALLLKDLQSKAPEVRAEAIAALNYYEFEEADLPGIYASLRVAAEDDTADTGSRIQLLRILKTLPVEGNVEVIREVLPSLKAHPPLVIAALGVLGSVKSEEALDLFFEPITEDLAWEEIYSYKLYSAFSVFRDSMELTSAYLGPLMGKTGIDYKLDRAIVELIQSFALQDSLDLSGIQAYDAKIKELIRHYLSLSLAEKEKPEEGRNYQYGYIVSLLGDILPVLNDETHAEAILKQMLNIDYLEYVPKDALIAMAKMGYDLDKKTLKRYAKDDTWRYSLAKSLYKIGKFELFPAKYATFQLLGESSLRAYVEDDEPSLKYIKTIKYDTEAGVPQEIHVFQIIYNADGSETYLGIAGPFPDKGSRFDFNDTLTGTIWDLWEKGNEDQQVVDILEYYKEE